MSNPKASEQAWKPELSNVESIRCADNDRPTAMAVYLFFIGVGLSNWLSEHPASWKHMCNLSTPMPDKWPQPEGMLSLPDRPDVPLDESEWTVEHIALLRAYESEIESTGTENVRIKSHEIQSRHKLYKMLMGQMDKNVLRALNRTNIGRHAQQREVQCARELISALRLFLIGDGDLSDTYDMYVKGKRNLEQVRMYASEDLCTFLQRFKAVVASAEMAAKAHRATQLAEHAEEKEAAEAEGQPLPEDPELVRIETKAEIVLRFLNCVNHTNTSAFKTSMESNAVLEFKNKALTSNDESKLFFRMNCPTIDDVVTNLQRAMSERRDRPAAYDIRPGGAGVYGFQPKNTKAGGGDKNTKAGGGGAPSGGGGGKQSGAGGGGKQSSPAGGKKWKSKAKPAAKPTETKEEDTDDGELDKSEGNGKTHWPRAATPGRVRYGNCRACHQPGHYARDMVCDEARKQAAESNT